MPPYALYNMLVHIYLGVDFVEIRLTMIEGSTKAGRLQAAPWTLVYIILYELHNQVLNTFEKSPQRLFWPKFQQFYINILLNNM
jgi:hypothetical protein